MIVAGARGKVKPKVASRKSPSPRGEDGRHCTGSRGSHFKRAEIIYGRKKSSQHLRIDNCDERMEY